MLILQFSQLYKDGTPIPYEQLKQEYGIERMQYNSLITAIPRETKQFVKACQTSLGQIEESQNFNKLATIALSDRPAHTVYWQLLHDQLGEKQEKQLELKRQRWEEELEEKVTLDEMLKATQTVFSVTNVPANRSFQYRLLQRAIITNKHLYRWKMRDNNMCSFCEKYKETYRHLFVECERIQPLWEYAEKYIQDLNCKSEVSFNSLKDVLLCQSVVKPIVNFIRLLVKKYVYRQRCLKKSVSARELELIIRQQKQMELYIATKNGKIAQHNKKWNIC